MILVLTTEAGDYSHIKFIDWLSYYKADYEILTGESIYNRDIQLTLKNNNLFINGRNYTKDVNVILNRRWLTVADLPKITEDRLLNKGLRSTIVSELYELRNYLAFNFKKAYWIPSIENTNVNKIIILHKARVAGLKTPNYIITNKKKEVIKFFNKHHLIITKAIGNFQKNYTDNNFLVNPIYTKMLSKNK